MTKAEQEKKNSLKLAYMDATRGKTAEEILAIDYFIERQIVKGCLRKKSTPAVTDEQIDALVANRTGEITSQGVLATLGLSAPPSWIIDPLKVCTPEFEEAEYVRNGADGKARASRVTTTFLLYAQEMMYIYSRTFSLTDRESSEFSASLMYRDITSVELRTESSELRQDSPNKKMPSIWIPCTTNNAVFTVPGKSYVVNVGGAKSVMANTIAKLREQIAKCKR